MFQDKEVLQPFTYRSSGNIGQEILDTDGKTVCWTTSEVMAALIVKLLNQASVGDG